jgi:hypothetical protein
MLYMDPILVRGVVHQPVVTVISESKVGSPSSSRGALRAPGSPASILIQKGFHTIRDLSSGQMVAIEWWFDDPACDQNSTL